jgi:plasmid stabilization system protein ParE
LHFIFKDVAEHNPRAASAVKSRIRKRIESLALFPMSGPETATLPLRQVWVVIPLSSLRKRADAALSDEYRQNLQDAWDKGIASGPGKYTSVEDIIGEADATRRGLGH